jgi:RNA polymerase sigma-70 factor (ECF subfamily)
MNPIAGKLTDEEALVVQAVAEPTAFASIYDHYFPRVYNYIRYRVRDAQLADDLTAQVFERVLATLHRYRPERAPFAGWLFSIVRNIIADHFRAQKRRRWLPFDFLADHSAVESQPEEITAANDSHHRLLEAAARLKDRERDLIALKFAAGLTNRQIAALTGLSESNVAVILYRSIQRLRTLLKDEA